MAITKLNNVLVKHGKVMFGIITAIIIVAFVWFFTPGADGSILFGSNPNSPDAVCGETVGEKILNKDITEVMKAYTLFAAARSNTKPDQNRTNISVEEAFQLAAIGKVSEKLGLIVTDEEVGKFIKSIPTFQKDGKFDMAAYKDFEKKMLIPSGYNAKDLDKAVRIILTMEALPRLFDNGVISPSEQAEFIKSHSESDKALKIDFTVESFKKGINPTEQELQAFYNSNKNLFLSPVKYKAEIVMFRYSDYKTAKKEDQKQLALKDAREFRKKVYKATETIAGNKVAYLQEYRKLAAKEPKNRYFAINWFSADAKELPGLGEENALKNSLILKAEETAPVTEAVEGKNAVFVAALTEVQPASQLAYAAAKADVRIKCIEQKAAAKMKETVAAFRAAVADAQKKNVKIDEKKLKELAKGAKISDNPPVKFFNPNASMMALEESARNNLAMFEMFNMPKEQKEQYIAQVLNQLQAARFAISLNANIINTKVGTLSKDWETPEGVTLFFVASRSAAEMPAAEKDMALNAQKNEKQGLAGLGMMEWVMKNTKNAFQQEKNQAKK